MAGLFDKLTAGTHHYVVQIKGEASYQEMDANCVELRFLSDGLSREGALALCFDDKRGVCLMAIPWENVSYVFVSDHKEPKGKKQTKKGKR